MSAVARAGCLVCWRRCEAMAAPAPWAGRMRLTAVFLKVAVVWGPAPVRMWWWSWR